VRFLLLDLISLALLCSFISFLSRFLAKATFESRSTQKSDEKGRDREWRKKGSRTARDLPNQMRNETEKGGSKFVTNVRSSEPIDPTLKAALLSYQLGEAAGRLFCILEASLFLFLFHIWHVSFL
jgi:hypothetical protein